MSLYEKSENAIVMIFSFPDVSRLRKPKEYKLLYNVKLRALHELLNNTTSLFFCWDPLGRREGGEVGENAGESV